MARWIGRPARRAGLALALLVAAAPATAAPPAPEPCRLQTERDRIVDHYAATVRARAQHRREDVARAREWIWSTIPYQPSCVDLAMRWLLDEQSDDNRVAAAAWLWQHRQTSRREELNVPVLSDLFGRVPWWSSTWHELPLTPEVRRRWVEHAAREPHPIVLRLQLAYLLRGGFDADARAVIRAGLGTVPREVELAELVLGVYARRHAAPLTPAERDLVWRMRHGSLGRQARFVLGRMRDPEWLVELEVALRGAGDQEALFEDAALAGLAPRFAPRLLAEARAAVAKQRGDCGSLPDYARRLTGASAETLELGRILLGCRGKLSAAWPMLVRSLSLAPDGDVALLQLARLQRQHGDPPFSRYGDPLAAALAEWRTHAAVDGLVELAHMTEGYGDDPSTLWGAVGGFVDRLRRIGTPHAAEGLVRLARLAAGPCERDRTSCLWRVDGKIRDAVKAIGGRDARRLLRELARVRPPRRGTATPRWAPPSPGASPAAPASAPSPRRSSAARP